MKVFPPTADSLLAIDLKDHERKENKRIRFLFFVFKTKVCSSIDLLSRKKTSIRRSELKDKY